MGIERDGSDVGEAEEGGGGERAGEREHLGFIEKDINYNAKRWQFNCAALHGHRHAEVLRSVVIAANMC